MSATLAAVGDSHALLELWESALGQTSRARDEALLRFGTGRAAAPKILGERNTALLALHARLFGSRIELKSRCPECGIAVEFEGDCEAVAAGSATSDSTRVHHLEAQGHSIEFRLPDSADLAAVAHSSAHAGDDEFARQLLARCVLASSSEGVDTSVGRLPVQVLDALSQAMEALDPAAVVSFGVACPQCGTHWDAPLDVGEAVWQKVRGAAERLLLDVDALARTYGWNESEVLRLSPARRAAYLQLATG